MACFPSAWVPKVAAGVEQLGSPPEQHWASTGHKGQGGSRTESPDIQGAGQVDFNILSSTGSGGHATLPVR